jgi:hypothetical protein
MLALPSSVQPLGGGPMDAVATRFDADEVRRENPDGTRVSDGRAEAADCDRPLAVEAIAPGRNADATSAKGKATTQARRRESDRRRPLRNHVRPLG